MERDFEREFRELKQYEIPDLWSRIEAGLSEKNNVASAPGNVIALDKGKRDIKRTFSWKKWGTLVAACVCVVIILPAFFRLIGNKGYSGSASGTAADNAAEEIYYEAAVEEASCDTEMEEGTGSMSGMADVAAAGDAAADGGNINSAITAEAVAEDTAEAEAVAEDTAEAENVAEDTAAAEKAVWENLSDGQILEEAVIQIQKAEAAGEEVLYQAVVLQADVDNILECGTQIALICNADTEYDFLRVPRDKKKLKEQETYRVTLRYDARDEGFVVLAAENWVE